MRNFALRGKSLGKGMKFSRTMASFMVLSIALGPMAPLQPVFAQANNSATQTIPPSASLASAPYKNPALPIEARVEDLLARMTIEEKIQQMVTIWQTKGLMFDANLQFDRAKARQNFPFGIGQVARPQDVSGTNPPATRPGRSPLETARLTNAIQHWAIEDSRLGIPIFFHEEGLHGLQSADGTHFPQAIGLASSWDPALVMQVNQVTAREMRVRGAVIGLTPVVDVAREPRWGRIEETFGEDPYLVGELGVAAVRGLQGDSLPLAPDHVFATLKHLTGHGQPESGTNTGPAEISERTLRENFFPPFEEIVRRTNIRLVMPSYNEIDGVPSHANRWLLTDILRGEWGFQGAISSDYNAIEEMSSRHHIAADYADAAIRALNAGVDMDLPDGASFGTLLASVRSGRVPVSAIDTSVRRILTLKFQAGLFEHPYVDENAAEAGTNDAAAQALSAEAARRSVVLLKNEGNLLPLDRAKVGKVAVIGPNGNAEDRIGGYSGVPRYVVTVFEGIKNLLGAGANVRYSEGVRITRSNSWWADSVDLVPASENARKIAQAVALARRSDTIVLVLGDTEQTSREAWSDTHFGDRDSLDLVGQQNDLARAIFALGKPTVVVLLNGRPPSYPYIAENAKAILEGWYVGQEGGNALAQILFGDANPGGKMPVTTARNVGQLPIFYNAKPSARRGYLFSTTEPLFPFGWGLSYTQFALSAPRLSASTAKVGDSVQVIVNVRNIGQRLGDEVVQLYVRDDVSSVTRPIKELKGFNRITLQPGEARDVAFTLDARSFQFWDAQMHRVVEPGTFTIMTGPNSVQLQSVQLTLTN